MSAAKQTEREKQLADERDDYQAKFEAAEAERVTAESERDDYQAKFEAADDARQQAEAQRDQLLDEAGKPTASTEQTEPKEPADTDPHAETKGLLRRMGLPRAYVLADGSTCFDEKHAKHVAGAEFASLTVISAE